MVAPQSDPAEAIIGYSQKSSRDREARITTAISTANGRKKTIVESRAAINHKPHHDKRPPKSVIKKPRILVRLDPLNHHCSRITIRRIQPQSRSLGLIKRAISPPPT